MQRIPAGVISLICADLPYGTTKCRWDKVIPFEPLWEQYWRTLKPNGAVVLFSQQPFTTDLINSCRKWFRYEIIWEKTVALGFPNARRMPLRSHETMLVFYRKLPTYNPQMVWNDKATNAATTGPDRYTGYNALEPNEYEATKWRFPRSVIKISNHHGAIFGNIKKVGKHPTRKPVPLIEWIVKTYTNEGDIVLDNVMGSGSTAIACINTGRQFIGFENDPDNFNYSQQRLANLQTPTDAKPI